MASYKDQAAAYATQIRKAGQAAEPLMKAAGVRVAKSAVSVAGARIERAVVDVFEDMDTLVATHTEKHLSAAEKARLLAMIEEELGVEQGSLEIIKKGSVAGAIEYETQLAQLLQVITYVD